MQAENNPAVLFPGQGSQEKGMGRELAENDAELMAVWKKAEQACGQPLREIFWDGEDKDMADTRVLQPALTTVNMTYWMQAVDKLRPAFLCGHSLGEFSALFAARVLSTDDVLTLTALRGRLMSEAGGDGAMAAVLKLDEAKVREIVEQAAAEADKELVLANLNTPVQFVISGRKDAVDAATALVKEARGRAVPLAVSGAFHSPLMTEAAAELANAMAKMDFGRPKTPVIFNVTADTTDDPEAIRAIMARQMTEGVRWIETINHAYDGGARHFVEFGPKGVLTRMVGPILKGRDDEVSTQSVASAADLAAL